MHGAAVAEGTFIRGDSWLMMPKAGYGLAGAQAAHTERC